MRKQQLVFVFAFIPDGACLMHLQLNLPLQLPPRNAGIINLHLTQNDIKHCRNALMTS